MSDHPGGSLPVSRRWFGSALSGRGFLPLSIVLMALFYAVLYHPYSTESLPGRALGAYLQFVAAGSAALLRWFGEDISVQGTTVLGRFPYVVVLDCAALDAQALFAAAVLAFPVSLRDKLIGLVGGLCAIWCINVARLGLLYFAGANSLHLFQVLHEEVMVMLVIVSVCGLFVAWARWAHARTSLPAAASVADAE